MKSLLFALLLAAPPAPAAPPPPVAPPPPAVAAAPAAPPAPPADVPITARSVGTAWEQSGDDRLVVLKVVKQEVKLPGRILKVVPHPTLPVNAVFLTEEKTLKEPIATTKLLFVHVPTGKVRPAPTGDTALSGWFFDVWGPKGELLLPGGNYGPFKVLPAAEVESFARDGKGNFKAIQAERSVQKTSKFGAPEKVARIHRFEKWLPDGKVQFIASCCGTDERFTLDTATLTLTSTGSAPSGK